MRELGGPGLLVVTLAQNAPESTAVEAAQDAAPAVHKLQELLPHAFGPEFVTQL